MDCIYIALSTDPYCLTFTH